MIEELQKLQVKDGDIILIRLQKNVIDLSHTIRRIGSDFQKALNEQGVQATIFIYPYGIDIGVMDWDAKVKLFRLLKKSLEHSGGVTE